MIKMGNVSELSGIKSGSKVINVVEEQLSILAECYVAERDIPKDLGGYVVILDDANDIVEIKETTLKYTIPEYTDNIECDGGKLCCLSLFLMCLEWAHKKTKYCTLVSQNIISR